jgi:four helix bundle protein
MELIKKVYDLEERTFEFAKNTRSFIKKLELNIWNKEDIKQVVRSSGSIAANYIEAIEKHGDKDFLMKLRISKKEAKETILWLRLIEVKTDTLEEERISLINEAKELQNILGAIYKKSISKKIA